MSLHERRDQSNTRYASARLDDALDLFQPATTGYTITPASEHSFRVSPSSGIHQLAHKLRNQGFQPGTPKNQAEAYRLQHPEGAIAILYNSGSVVAQGSQADRLVTYLNRLAGQGVLQ